MFIKTVYKLFVHFFLYIHTELTSYKIKYLKLQLIKTGRTKKFDSEKIKTIILCS